MGAVNLALLKVKPPLVLLGEVPPGADIRVVLVQPCTVRSSCRIQKHNASDVFSPPDEIYFVDKYPHLTEMAPFDRGVVQRTTASQLLIPKRASRMSNQSESLHLQPAEGTPAETGLSTASSEFELEIAGHLVEALNLEVAAADIDPEERLYDGSLGLDSIDILEIALTISKKYGLQLRADDENNHQIFATLRTLAAHVQANRQA